MSDAALEANMSCWKKLKFWRRRTVVRSEELREERYTIQEQLETRVTELEEQNIQRERVESTLRGRITELEEELRKRELRRQNELIIIRREARFEIERAKLRIKELETQIRKATCKRNPVEAHQKDIVNALCVKLRSSNRKNKELEEQVIERERVESTLRGRIIELEEELSERELRQQKELLISVNEGRFEMERGNERIKVLETQIQEEACKRDSVEALQKCTTNKPCGKLGTTKRNKDEASKQEEESVHRQKSRRIRPRQERIGIYSRDDRRRICREKKEVEFTPDKTDAESAADKNEMASSPEKTEVEPTPDKTQMESAPTRQEVNRPSTRKKWDCPPRVKNCDLPSWAKCRNQRWR
jgi:hypothetical protein